MLKMARSLGSEKMSFPKRMVGMSSASMIAR